MTKINYTFPSELRLLTPSAFRSVFQKPIRIYQHPFTLLGCHNDFNHPRLGFAISKKHIKFAYQRNHIKRLVRESFRLNQHQLPHIDFVVLVQKSALTYSNIALKAVIEKLWQRYSALSLI